MGLRIYKRKRVRGGYIGVSPHGVTAGKRKGRVTASTRGVSIRILPGVSIRLPF